MVVLYLPVQMEAEKAGICSEGLTVAKNKEMDQLTQWAVEANRLGMTYGQYVAKYHPEKQPEVRFPKKSKGALKNEDGVKICQWCGKEIPPDIKSWRYCCPECAHEAHEKQKMRRYDQKKMAGALGV